MLALPVRPVGAATLPAGFSESVVFSGLVNPTVVEFAADRRVFVAEKSGLIKVFDGLSDTTPTTVADLRTSVHNFWDRGLLGMALHPEFPSTPYVYVLYTHDAAIGGTAPRWGAAGASADGCPSPPGATGDGCVVSGRLSRLQISGSTATSETVMLEDWCQQYPSHSVGALAFGADGALYVSGGDGASFTFADYGQDGSPVNPCGDPPGGVGGVLTPPTAEGGALRSQDVRTRADPTGLDGTILRIDPMTGAGLPDNPYASYASANARRIFATGLRNPFRIAVKPGTSQVYAGDVGWNTFEEINKVSGGSNFGWPCYEGGARHASYDGLNLDICENLYAAGSGAVTAPMYAYNHSAKVVAGETCGTGSSSIAGLTFSTGAGNYPAKYDGALFFADYSRNCIWAMPSGTNGEPDPTRIETLVAGASGPVNLTMGPDGNLYYPDFNGGRIIRVNYTDGNQAPVARITADPTSGQAPLTVNFDGRGSSDPEGSALTYAWDLDGDGAYNDATTATASRTYAAGEHTVRLRVTDPGGASDTASATIHADSATNTPPTATIDAPAAGTTWRVGDVISFSGTGTDAQDGALPGSSLSWSLTMQHCPTTCHAHPGLLGNVTGRTGSFTAPDHEYPAHLELSLTVTDSGGLSDSETLRLDPRTVALTFQTNPGGLKLQTVAVGGSTTQATPFTKTVIVGSKNTLVAVTPQTVRKTTYHFKSWSDGGAATHDIIAPATATTYTATYRKR